MRNRMLQLAGVLALLAVIGKFYAVPAIAQAVRAALVQNRDEPARNFYWREQGAGCSGGRNCIASFPAVPAGKRLIVQNVSASVLIYSPGDDLISVDVGGLDRDYGPFSRASLPRPTVSPVLVSGTPPGRQYYLNQTALVSFDAAEVPYFQLVTGGADSDYLTAFLSGYMIDIP